MFELKRISREGIPAALEKAERYRLLNEAWEAESICRDILALEPENQAALVTLLLAITDQFRTEGGDRVEDAKALIPQLDGNYAKAYYAGIIWERRATAVLRRQEPGWGPVAYDRLRQAMTWYEKAGALKPAGDDSAVVRWNSCVRMITRFKEVQPAQEQGTPTLLE
jgi:hypothetical protein